LLKEAIGLPQRGSTLTRNIRPTKRLIRLSLSLIVRIWAGKLMFASSPRDTLTTEHTALPRRRLRTSHNSIISLTLILRREEKASSLERKVVIHLEKPWLKYSNGIPTFQQPMKFQTTLFQTNSTSDLLMDLISQTH